MLKARWNLLGLLIVTAIMTPQVMAQDREAATLWADFNHYVRIARPDLALASGNRLLEMVDDQQLVDIVESSEAYRDYEATLLRAARTPTLEDVAREFRERIQAGRIARSRDPERILADIQKLADGARANRNATERLRAAGQYAAPALLATLLDESQMQLHPYVLAAMVAVGRPMVYPLCEALPDLEPVPQGQISQVLAEIGYPRGLPYIKLILERENIDPNTQRIADAAFRSLAQTARIPYNVSAAELFLTLGQNYYSNTTRNEAIPGFDAADGQGIVWHFDRRAGLIPVPVPAEIFGDVLTMAAARQSFDLNPGLSPALSLWLASNLRRANRLPEGAQDLSYPATMLEPEFYIKAAGPLRQHDVLHRALNDSDTELALDAIDALAATAGTDALVNREGTVQPLLRALSYPDRRVRFAAAFAMTNARPRQPFDGSFRVVPVLAEAVRQTDIRYALILGRDQNSVNRISSAMRELGYQTIAGQSLADIGEMINAGPGVDMIVTDKPVAQVEALNHETATNYKLAAVPMLALTTPGDQIEFNRTLHNVERLRSVLYTDDPQELRDAVEQAAAAYAGRPITSDEALAYASTAIELLYEIAIGSSREVYHITDAQPALLQALEDPRESIVIDAAEVLALIDSNAAQRAIADAALDDARPEAMRIALLGSLAESATHHGGRLEAVHLDQLLALVRESTGDLAVAAARTHGALTLPTSNIVGLIRQQSKR